MTIPPDQWFDTSLRFLIGTGVGRDFGVEGGWWPGTQASDPNPTFRGITQRTYDAYRKRLRKPFRDVRLCTDAELRRIYWGYWEDADCHRYDWPICLALFDCSVNSGPGNARKLWARSLNLGTFLAVRQEFYDAIIARKPHLAPNAGGWRKRLDKLKRFIAENP